MLEAAAPKRAAVGRSMQMLAMIRRLESPGLKPFVDIEENAPLTQEDIRAKPFRLEFLSDRRGAPQPAEITLRLDSPDFEPKSQVKKLMVPPDRDSEVCTFLLTPKVGGELLLNLEVLKGEVLVASRAIRTVAEITEQQMVVGQNVLVSIPLEVIAYSLRAQAGGMFTQLFASPPSEGKASAAPPVPAAGPPSASSPQATPQTSPAEFTRMPIPPAPASAAPRDYGTVSAPPRPMASPIAMPPPTVRAPAPPRRAPAPMPALPRPQTIPIGARRMAPPKDARWGMWAALLVLLVGVGGGGLYVATRPSSPALGPTAVATSAQNSTPAAAPAPSPAMPGPSQASPPSAPAPEAATAMPRPAAPASPPLSAEPNLKAIRAKTTMGDFYFARGDYDAAIAAYQEGLKLDPSNEVLRQKLSKVIKECEAENRVLDEHDKCGAPAAPPTPPAPAKQ